MPSYLESTQWHLAMRGQCQLLVATGGSCTIVYTFLAIILSSILLHDPCSSLRTHLATFPEYYRDPFPLSN